MISVAKTRPIYPPPPAGTPRIESGTNRPHRDSKGIFDFLCRTGSDSVSKVLFSIICLTVACASKATQTNCVVDPETVWLQRAELISEDNTNTTPIDQAIECYHETIHRSPEALEIYWKLMRVLYFKGVFMTTGKAARRATFDRATRVAVSALAVVEKREVQPVTRHGASGANQVASDTAAVYFWAAVSWGYWGRITGKLQAARMGVAKRIRDYAMETIVLDPEYERAGGHRILGRLHAQAPRVPLVTWWVDRDIALRELEHAFSRYPTDPYNALYFAQALVEHEPKRSAEALDIVRKLLARSPDPRREVEEQAVIAEAQATLDEWLGTDNR